MSEKFIVTFNNVVAYRKYKEDVIKSGGTISNDLGEIIMGFTASIPPTLLAVMTAPSLGGNGISSLEKDSTVRIQA